MRKAVYLSALFAVLAACSATTKHKVLSVLFDGVPERQPAADPVAELVEPEAPPVLTQPEEPEPEMMAAALVAGGYEAVDQLPLRPVPRRTAEVWQPSDVALEKADTWEDALRMLPLDVASGVDWVEAAEEGLHLPQLVLEVDATAPFTLDTLVASGITDPTSPFLDFTVTMTPDDNPFFQATFPHSSHTLFLACSSCHPGVKEWDVEMDQILAGRACGQCHGRVSFAAETGCARCHQSLEPPPEATAAAELEKALSEPLPSSPELLERGDGLYRQYCAFCHGDDGGGDGRFARWLVTKPRDFAKGTYKFRSTLGPLPRDEDLFMTITRGVPGTSMPAWPALAYEDRWALVHYIKTFSDWFSEEEPEEPITVSEPPAVTAELLREGQELYTGSGCNSCHGDQGRGDGPSAPTLKDSWGQPIRPFNFASGRPMKSGAGVETIFRVVMTGIGGTPMPVFGQSLTPQQAWAVARYVESFEGQEPEPFAVRGEILFRRHEATNGQTAPEDPAGDQLADGDDDFWGVGGEDETAAEDDFWGVGADEEPAAAAAEDDFWGVGADEEPTVAAAAAAEDDFWGVGADEEPAAAAVEDDFWGDGDGAEDGTDGDDFWGGGEEAGAPVAEPEVPPATFPHWFHRIRFKCANCHPRVFEMKAGANPITMDGMRAGLHCAKCHNGKIAWEIGFTTCPKCHQARPAAARPGEARSDG